MAKENVIMVFEYKGYWVEVAYDYAAENPRKYAETALYGYDSKVSIKDLLNEDGNIDLNCEELRDKWYALVSKTEHSTVSLYIGSPRDKWDSSLFGVIAIDKSRYDEDTARKLFVQELSDLESHINGDRFEYVAKDNDGNIVDSCGNFYGTEAAIGEAKSTIDWLKWENEKKAVKYWAENSD